MKTPIKLLTLLALPGIAGSPLMADTFHPVNDIAAPNMVDGNAALPLTNVIEGAGVGFDINPPHDTTGSVWYTTGAGASYIDGNPGDELIFFDLGADVPLGEISVWGYSSGNGNGIREFDVRFATDAEGGDPGILGDESYGTSITLNPFYEAALDPIPRQSFGFGETVTARYVEVWAVTNYYQNGGVPGGDRLGIGEISFAIVTATGAPDIEAPASVALDLEGVPTDYDIPIRNTGDTDLTLTFDPPTFTGPNAAAFSITISPAPIGSFITDNIVVHFDPTGLDGPIEATLNFTSDDPDEGTLAIPITGYLGPQIYVTSPFVAELDPAGATFDVPVGNVGGDVLTISGTAFTGTNAGAFTATVVPATIASDGGTDFITIVFDPTGVGPGAVDATLQIMSDDVVNPTAEVVIDGGLPVIFHSIASVTTNANQDYFSKENLLQGIGVGFETLWPHNAIGAASAATWVTDDPNGNADYFPNDVADPIVLTFDLGQDQPLIELSTWGYADSNTNGAKDFTVLFATEADGLAGFGTSVTYNPSFEAAFSATPRDSHLFTETVTARYVEITITDNWRGLQGLIPGGDRVGLGEVAFEAPETTTFPDFVVTNVSVLGGGNVELTFESIEGIIYEMERSPDGENWTLLTDTAVGIAGGISTITDTTPLGGTAAVLYRIVNTGQTAP